MSGIMLHNNSNLSATYVSNQFIDHYMTSANGEYVKVYLYLLRCMGSDHCSFSISSAADLFDHTEKDIQRALRYWEKVKLLHLEYDSEKKLSGIQLLPPEAPSEPCQDSDGQALPELPVSGSQEPLAPAAPVHPVSFTAGQLAEFQKKDDVKELLFVTEHYLKRPLTPTDINTILFWYEELQFPVALMEYLIEYCIGRGHTSLQYMNKVAISWKESGINTVERAKQAASAFGRLHFSVMRALGIQGRNLIPSEVSMIERWSKNYGFSQELIEEACRRTIAATHQPNFEYTDSILRNWHKQQVHTLADISRLDQVFQKARTAPSNNRKTASNKFNNFSQRTYDYDKLEQQLLTRG